MWTKRYGYMFLAVTVFVLLWSRHSVFAQVTVFNDPIQFDLATGAIVVPIPDSQTAFPGTICGFGDIGPTGIGGQVDIGFNSNMVTITNVSGGELALCIFDNGTIITTPNINPNVMIANTIVGNGEDDFLLVFANPVHAVGFRFLTNFLADEEVTLKDEAGNIISVEDIDALTPTNTRQFVGFQSNTPIKSVIIDTDDGDVENEGFDALKVAETFPIVINIKPDSFPNSINPNSKGVIPVAILTTEVFDATTVDPGSVRFGPSEAIEKHGVGHIEDVDMDGDDDVVYHFPTQDSGIQCGDTTAMLTGTTLGGQSVMGLDSIVTRGCK